MSYLEKLLDGAQVEWKALAEVVNFLNGKGHENDITENGRYIVVNSKFISSNGKVAKFSKLMKPSDILLYHSSVDLPVIMVWSCMRFCQR